MTETAEAPAATPVRGGRSRPGLLVGGLAVTQTVGYGVLFYAFAVLLTPITVDLGASTAEVTGALTTAIVVAAGAAIPIGRWLDRHGGRALLTAGSLLGVVAVVAWSQVQHVWQLYAVFILIGLAGAASLYEAAFPVVIATVHPRHRDRALLVVTIVAGFASSIFFPLTGLLLDRFGWRSTLIVLAALLAIITVPVHASLVPSRVQFQHQQRAGHHGAAVREALRDNRFWLLTVAFVAQAAAVSAVGVLLIGYLQLAGHTATLAAGLSGLLGVLSVTGRLVTTGIARRLGMTTVTATIFAVQAIGVLALPHLGQTMGGAAICVIAFGLGFGVATIARPAIVADRYGTARYATIAAGMTLPITLAKAFGPLAGAAITPNTFLTAAGVCCLVSAGLLWIGRTSNHPTHFAANRARLDSYRNLSQH
jgi:predicted MFS family arabinose efflux permease